MGVDSPDVVAKDSLELVVSRTDDAWKEALKTKKPEILK